MGSNIASILAERRSERYALHARYMNEMIVRMRRTLGYDVCFRSGEGPYLFDDRGDRYLDLLSGGGYLALAGTIPDFEQL